MENRCTFYNQRSKVKKALKDEMIEIDGEKNKYGTKFMLKTYRKRKCRWCGMQFDKESIYCKKCGSCQYCGHRIPGGNRCPFCGNTEKKNDNIEINKYIIH